MTELGRAARARGKQFDGGVVLVLGAARGIGRAVAEGFARQGADVTIADTDWLPTPFNHYQTAHVGGFGAACALAERLTGEGLRARAREVDAADPEAVDRLFNELETVGRLDAVVNAFGVTHVCPVADMTLREFDAVVRGNLHGVFVVCQRAIAPLTLNGGGSIINFSSISGRTGFAKVAHYCAAKFAVVGFTSALALEVAARGIRVNAICPGIVATNMWDYLLGEFTREEESREACWDRMTAMIPQRRSQTPEDVADLALYLASATAITGQAISIDGGMMAPS
jgi:meso-butanediol dehydrogenase/(S,S)-butanediol dehydrogenase/diacetyl reductase